MNEINTTASETIAVLGATGKIGSQVIQFLSAAGIPGRALTRNIARATPYPGITWIAGDMNDDEMLLTLLQGCKKLFLNSGVDQNMASLQSHIIDLAKASGIEYILKLSTPAAKPDAKDPLGAWHWQVEEYLKQSGLHWNVLQPQSFMQNWLGDMAATIKSARIIYDTASEGKKAFIDTRDIGEVAVALFMEPADWINTIIPISGPALVSYYEVAAAFSEAIGEKVTYSDLSPDEFFALKLKKGMPDWLIKTFLAVSNNQRLGLAEKWRTENASRIMGKPGRTVPDFARDHLAAFK